jgi:hypothetical protein
MPALTVTLNGQFLVSVGTEGFDIVDVGISGDVLGPQHATLRVSGGSYPAGRPSTYLIWDDERHLSPGDRVSVEFSATGSTSRPGRTIEELYRDEEPMTSPAPETPEKMVEELKRRPKHFSSLAFELLNAEGRSVRAETLPSEHGYGFTVLWDSWRPETARAAVHTYTLDSLITKEDGRYHSNARLSYGQGVTFIIREAPNSTVERDAPQAARPSL